MMLVLAVSVLILGDGLRASYAKSSEKKEITPTEAYEKYKENYPNTKVRKVELKNKKGAYVYKVKGFDGKNKYKMKINKKDGKIIKEKVKHKKKNYEEVPKEYMEKVDHLVEEAIKDTGGNASLHKWKVKHDDGKYKLKIKLKSKSKPKMKYKYKYNLETGELIKKKIKKK